MVWQDFFFEVNGNINSYLYSIFITLFSAGFIY